MSNPVMHWQIISPTPTETRDFYCHLFGWQAAPPTPLGFQAISTDSEQGIQGGIWPAPAGAPSFVQLFVQVDDCPHYVAQATALGGSVLFPPQTLPDGDTVAIVRDPAGMTFGIIQPSQKKGQFA